MKFTCERYLLQNAIATASRAAAVKSAVPSLEGLLIESDGDRIRVSGYDLKTGIVTGFPADVIEQGDIVINARLFGDIVRKMAGDFVSVEIDGNSLVKITSEMSEFEIMGSPAGEYPELPTVDYVNGVTVTQSCLKSMISQTVFAVSDNEARPIHTGALFEVENGMLTVVAVDGYRLALRREEIAQTSMASDCSFVVPGTALGEVEKILADTEEDVVITLGSKHTMFKIGDTTLISRRLEGEFLNYKKSIPAEGKYEVEVDRRALVDSVERVSLIISDKLKSPVRCVFDDGVVRLATTTPLGRASDECEIKGDGGKLTIGFNNRYLLDALKAAPADSVVIRLTSGVSPCIILPPEGGNNFLYMILPVRLKGNED